MLNYILFYSIIWYDFYDIIWYYMTLYYIHIILYDMISYDMTWYYTISYYIISYYIILCIYIYHSNSNAPSSLGFLQVRSRDQNVVVQRPHWWAWPESTPPRPQLWAKPLPSQRTICEAWATGTRFWRDLDGFGDLPVMDLE